MIGVVVVVVAVVVLAGVEAWGRFVAQPRIEAGLRGLSDDRLERLWRSPLDGRQRGWVAAERERRKASAGGGVAA